MNMTASETLNYVLDYFSRCNDNVKILHHLLEQDIIHPSFEQRYILNNDQFRFVVTEIVNKSNNCVEFYLEAADTCPYRAELIFEEKWYLKSFRFLCQGCFALNPNCNVCGGEGWGVL